MLYHCRMWCYAIGVEAVVLRSWCVILCTVCQLVSNCWILTDKFHPILYRKPKREELENITNSNYSYVIGDLIITDLAAPKRILCVRECVH